MVTFQNWFRNGHIWHSYTSLRLLRENTTYLFPSEIRKAHVTQFGQRIQSELWLYHSYHSIRLHKGSLKCIVVDMFNYISAMSMMQNAKFNRNVHLSYESLLLTVTGFIPYSSVCSSAGYNAQSQNEYTYFLNWSIKRCPIPLCAWSITCRPNLCFSNTQSKAYQS